MATLRRFPIGCTLGLMLGSLALSAQAEPPASSASNNNGLMSFPNVRVVNAPIAEQPQAKAKAKGPSTAAGMKAYMDDKGNLREPMSTDAAAISSTRIKAGSKTVAADSALTEEPVLTYGPDGAVGMMLSDEHMVFSVVHKDANGKLTQQCVTGETNAAHALHAQDVPAASKETSNDR